ncbi:DGQHR domain-containing protein [Bacillus sp. FJAT-42376]|uniref:DGQHR domain-containing protein n=1 Tax=Bacillus sp. FJAT-42376 TaxID=2014076 RepID=UPI000F4E671E|nr:DGQHR domain-containing protein [Bacillus sp. FJAT-42376]AZB43793.1 DGQHR domain-containing protein [Bacillus sp. FJAT-42376]
MNKLNNNLVIENVIQSKMRGRIIYQSNLLASDALKLTYVKPYNDPSGVGYQRPVSKQRCKDFSKYLSCGTDALFTPILLNAMGGWEFSLYDSGRPGYGRLICKNKASLMDGQHRLGGIELYFQETQSNINIPFLAFHYLDDEEEIKLFDTINTKAKGIGTSLSTYLKRDKDDFSWVATNLITNEKSPFNKMGTIVGKRSKGKHITLQNLHKSIALLAKNGTFKGFTKEKILLITEAYFNIIKDLFSDEWDDYKDYKLTHIVSIHALSILGSHIIPKYIKNTNKTIDIEGLKDSLEQIKDVDWSIDGELKYIKGISGSKTLANDLLSRLI